MVSTTEFSQIRNRITGGSINSTETAAVTPLLIIPPVFICCIIVGSSFIDSLYVNCAPVDAQPLIKVNIISVSQAGFTPAALF